MWSWPVVALVLTVMTVTAPASAQSIPPEQRVEFNRLVQQRNRLIVQLRRQDEQAAALVKQGRDATIVHADQVSSQDRLDLVELRLAILATRYGLKIPEPPSSDGSRGDEANGSNATDEQRFESAFARGKTRTLRLLQREGRRFLESLDFEAFLASP
jgi:hypothetical protein